MTTRRPRTAAIAARIAAALAALAASACASDPNAGYAFTSAYDDSIRTVALPMFGNDTFSPQLEVHLTDALASEIHRSTPWRVASPQAADAVLTGSITDVDLRKLTTDSDSGLVQEMAVEITVAFEFRSNDTGRVLVGRRNFRVAEPFVPARGASERLATGEQAAVDQLAREIVATLRDSW